MVHTRLPIVLLRLALSCAAVVLAAGAHASQKAAAESLFQEGKRLLDQGRYAEACPKFEASHNAEPSVGAMLNLARCHELEGRTATAWAEYKEAAKLAARAGQSDREQGAREFAEKLKPRLSKLTVEVRHDEPDLAIKRNGLPVPRGSWGTAVAMDPGTYDIEATARGKQAFRATVVVGPNGDHQSVVVPALEDAAPDEAPPPQEGDSGVDGLAVAGYAVGALGVVALGLGTAAGIVAIDREKELKDLCNGNTCPSDQHELLEEANTFADLSTAGITVGAVLAAAGITMIVVSATSDSDVEAALRPVVGPSNAGLALGGRF